MEKNPKKIRSDSFYYVLAIKIASDLIVTIAVPAILATVFGIKLDNHFQTKPILTIILLVISFVITAVMVVRKAYKYAKIYN